MAVKPNFLDFTAAPKRVYLRTRYFFTMPPLTRQPKACFDCLLFLLFLLKVGKIVKPKLKTITGQILHIEPLKATLLRFIK